MIKLLDKLIYYNANSKDKSVGDCVVRSLSLAFDKDYNATRAELNRMKRNNGIVSYRYKELWKQYIQMYEGDSYREIKASPNTTVADLAYDENGTLVVLCKNPDRNSRSTHLVTIIDHDIYDSWDSSDWIVDSYWKISNTKGAKGVDLYYCSELVKDSIIDNVVKYSKLYKLDGSILNDNIKVIEADEYELIAKFYYSITYGDDFHSEHKDFRCNIPYKFSPRGTNVEQIISRVSANHVKQFLKNIRKEIDDYNENAELHSRYDDLFTGDETLRNKLPYWCRKLITYIEDTKSYGALYRYEAGMQPLPGDPTREEVRFYADTWKELLQQIEWYKDDYSRYNRDY